MFNKKGVSPHHSYVIGVGVFIVILFVGGLVFLGTGDNESLAGEAFKYKPSTNRGINAVNTGVSSVSDGSSNEVVVLGNLEVGDKCRANSDCLSGSCIYQTDFKQSFCHGETNQVNSANVELNDFGANGDLTINAGKELTRSNEISLEKQRVLSILDNELEERVKKIVSNEMRNTLSSVTVKSGSSSEAVSCDVQCGRSNGKSCIAAFRGDFQWTADGSRTDYDRSNLQAPAKCEERLGSDLGSALFCLCI
jgi:hypothetical protein